MKIALLALFGLISATVAIGQGLSSHVEVVTAYSQNEKFYLKSIPFDSEFPTLRGKTLFSEKGKSAPRYVFERGFDSVGEHSNNLILSNDGEVIFFLIPWGANEEEAGLQSITFYRHGKLVKSFSETDITGCDKAKERCTLLYSNFENVVDQEKSTWGKKSYRRAFKQGVNDQEKFLSDFPIFAFDDTVYLVDSKRTVHLFDLKDCTHSRGGSFDDVFERIRSKGRFNRTEITTYEAPILRDFPRLRNGKDSYRGLADQIGMEPAHLPEPKDEQYKKYRFKIKGNISQDGTLEIENIEFFDELPREMILEFFKANKFDSSFIPEIFEKWNIGGQYFHFRKANIDIARQEKQQEILKARQELEKRMTLETIKGVYIPKDLGECAIELDKLLTEIDKKEMRALSNRNEMIRYHMGLGRWLRNNWGLWGGSRLQRYFTTRGVTHPDDMSSVVLVHYYDWLQDQKETWKTWERNPK